MLFAYVLISLLVLWCLINVVEMDQRFFLVLGEDNIPVPCLDQHESKSRLGEGMPVWNALPTRYPSRSP